MSHERSLRSPRVHNSSLLGLVLTLSLIGTMTPGSAFAQSLYGSLVGTVTDASGGVLPGATVTMTNTENGLVRTAVTESSGTYTVANVLPGLYDVKVTLEGFKEFSRRGVPITVGGVSRVEVKLELGALAETITVAGESALLQTDKADVHVELRSQAVVSLPLPAYRNYQSLVNLVPGATPGTYANTIDTPGKSLRTTINGTNSSNNVNKLDGATNINIWLPHHVAYVAPAETIDTVNVVTNSFDADQGMAGGAAITVITKSGTNQLRGSAFGFYNTNNWNARPYFAAVKPEGTRTITGGTVGGPIRRNRLFYFASFEGMYERGDSTGNNARIYTVPTEKMRSGDFSEVSAVIYNPFTGNPDGTGRVPFPGNIIPPELLSSISKKVQTYYPLPNRGGTTANYYKNYLGPLSRNNYDVKLNWNRSSSHQIWGKFSVLDAYSHNLTMFGFDDGGNGRTTNYLTTIGTTLTLTPRTLLEGTVGFTNLNQLFRTADFGTNYGTDIFGIPGTNGPDIMQSGMPYFTTGMTTLGNAMSWYPMERHDRSFTLSSAMTFIRGKHDIRTGIDMVRHALNHWQPEVGAGPRGGFSFGGGVTALRGGASPSIYNQYAAFLLGLPTSVAKTLQYEVMSAREWQFGLYLRDRWAVNQNVTLSLGLRWEYYPWLTRADRGVELLDLDTMTVLLGGLGGNPMDLGIDVSKTLFAPRLGATYRLNEDTVLRAGYGLTYNPLPFSRPLRGFYPATIANTYSSPNSYVPYGPLANGIPYFTGPDLSSGKIPLPNAAQMRSPDPDNVSRGYIQSWNGTIERRLPFDVSVAASYVGTKTTRGMAYQDINAGVPGKGAAGQPYYATFGRTAATEWWGGITHADYHALQVAINRPFKGGVMLKGAYTLSRAQNMADDDGWQSLLFNTPSEVGRNYAIAGFDRTHVLQMGFLFEAPIDDSNNAFWAKVFRQWQVNGVFSAFSGTPFTVTASGTSLNAPGNTQTADLVGTVNVLGGIGPGQPYFDPAAWKAITEPRFGDTGRNSVRGPGQWNVDLSVSRSFALRGSQKIEVRVEAFNLTNTPKFGNPNANVSGANFMEITSASGERNVRFGLRFAF